MFPVLFIVVIVSTLIYFISIDNKNSESHDGRIVIYLNTEERDMVLYEMRTFLISVQQITKGIAENDMEIVYKNARIVGRAEQAEVPQGLQKKLPMSFKKLGRDTHVKFDELAINARDLGDKDYSLSELSTLMNNCISCHETYRLEVRE